LPAASVAFTRYEYEVEAVSPVSLNVVPVGVAICAKFAQPVPEQRSTLYPVTPTLSVDAVHDKLTCAGEAAVAVKLVGAVGGVVSGGGVVVEEPLEHPPNAKSTPAPSNTIPDHLDSIRFANRMFIFGLHRSFCHARQSEGGRSRGRGNHHAKFKNYHESLKAGILRMARSLPDH